MADILEARLPDSFVNAAILRGVIHSKYHSVLNLNVSLPSGGNRLITMITSATEGIPDSITVPEEYFYRIKMLPVGQRMVSRYLNISFTDIPEILSGSAAVVKTSELRIESAKKGTKMLLNFIHCLAAAVPGFKEKSRNNGFSIWNSSKKNEIISELQGFVRYWLEQNLSGMEKILLKHIGRGIGLTPSCDDAFLGMIAICSGAKLYAEHVGAIGDSDLDRWKALPDIGCLMPFHQLLLNRTTDVSLKYLCCSQEGRFSDVMIALIQAVFSDSIERMESNIKAVSLVGESSGMDVLLGMEIASKELEFYK